MTLSLRHVISAELRRLGADAVHISENGGRKHPRIVARFGDRELEMPAPRGNIPDRYHIKRNYMSATRRRVRAFLQQRRRNG